MSSLKQKINKLTTDEKKKILRLMILEHNLEHTKNGDGYFFKLSDLDPALIKELEVLMDQLQINREKANAMEQKRREEIENFRRVIADKLHASKVTQRKDYLSKVTFKETSEYSNVKLVVTPVTKVFGGSADTPGIKWSTRFDYHPVYKRMYEMLKKQARLQRHIAAKMIKEHEENETDNSILLEVSADPEGEGGGEGDYGEPEPDDGDLEEEEDLEPEEINPEPEIDESGVEEDEDDSSSLEEEKKMLLEEDPDEIPEEELEPEIPEELELEGEEEENLPEEEEEDLDLELERQMLRLQKAGFEFNEDDAYKLEYKSLFP